MPTELPELPDNQYLLPELVGVMFDSTILAGDAIRLVADMWCRYALDGLFCEGRMLWLLLGRVVRPLRNAAESVRAAARAAAALEEGDADERLTTSCGRRLTRMLALTPLQIRLVNRSPSGCGDVLHPRGHHFVLCVFGSGTIDGDQLAHSSL